jgi:hypothetical protein
MESEYLEYKKDITCTILVCPAYINLDYSVQDMHEAYAFFIFTY